MKVLVMGNLNDLHEKIDKYNSKISITDWINKVENLVNAKDAQFVLYDCIDCVL